MIVFLVLLAVIAPIVIVAPLQDDVVLPKLVTTATFSGAALVWGAVLLARGRWPAGRWPATLWAPVVIFVVVNVLALIFARDWRWSLMGEHLRYQGLATTLLYVLLFAVAAVAVRSTRDLRWLLLGLFAGALGVAIYALIQEAGLDWVDWFGRPLDRPFATLGQPNALGAFLVTAAAASAFLVLTARERWQQAVLGLGVVVMLVALFLTVSRSALLAVGIVVLLWGAVAAYRFLPAVREQGRGLPLKLGLVALAAVPLILALLAVFFIGLPQGRVAIISDTNNEAVQGRLSLWRLSLEMTADRPLLGHGHDAFTLLFSSYRDRPDLPGIGTNNVAPESSHNFFLDLASGTGVLGLLAFLVLVGAVFWHAGRRALRTNDGPLQVALVALSTALVGNLIALFFGFSEAMTTWVFWLLLGATAGLLRKTAEDPRRDDERRGSGALATGLAAFGLAAVGVVALGWAATLTAADLAAGQAEQAARRGEHQAAARLAGRAATLNPIQKTYVIQMAQGYERSITGDEASLEQAIATYETVLRRFEPAAFDVLNLAMGKFQLARMKGTPVDQTFGLFERAVELDPYNLVLRRFLADLYDELGHEGPALTHRIVIYCWSVDCD